MVSLAQTRHRHLDHPKIFRDRGLALLYSIVIARGSQLVNFYRTLKHLEG